MPRNNEFIPQTINVVIFVIVKNSNLNEVAALALDFITNTSKNIFLTGGAGTGKTTFLRYLKENTRKKTIIAAPTGVAAINAGGTTIHSLFSLPARLLDEKLVKTIRLNSQTKALLREIELLIIDEASMLRADVLDAMDYILRQVRNVPQPLGGVQIVLIGDLFQLPPIENFVEKSKHGYPSLYFIDSKVFSCLDMLRLELTTVYRQSEPEFLNLLNDVRTGCISEGKLAELNNLYNPNWAKENAIILTTHNKYASEVNEEQLNNLPGTTYNINAEISGDFAEDQYPVEGCLRLRIGSRVMITKNGNFIDTGLFNGKIGFVISVSDEAINVAFDDGTNAIVVRETWFNLVYALDDGSDKVKEQVIGTFRQFPLKLAWAITVHKSQGLTFEKAVIDVAHSFAPGQVYVALSRVKSLKGLFLKSRIPSTAIICPPVNNASFKTYSTENSLRVLLEQEKQIYTRALLLETFNWSVLTDFKNQDNFSQSREISEKLEKYASSFSKECDSRLNGSIDWQTLYERVEKAEIYFVKEIDCCINLIKDFIRGKKDDFKFRGSINFAKKYIKAYQEKAQSIILVKKVIFEIQEGRESATEEPFILLTQTNEEYPEHITPTLKPISSEAQTLAMFKMGKSIKEISQIRSLAVSTIEYHLSSYIPTGDIEISKIIPQDVLDKVLPSLRQIKSPSTEYLRSIVDNDLSIGQLYALSVYLK